MSRTTYNRAKPIHDAVKAGNPVAKKIMAKVDLPHSDLSVSAAEQLFKAKPEIAAQVLNELDANPKISVVKRIKDIENEKITAQKKEADKERTQSLVTKVGECRPIIYHESAIRLSADVRKISPFFPLPFF